MKKFLSQFFLRGLTAAAGGPVVLAVIYGILGAVGVITTLTPKEVCTAILSITLLALLAGGMTAIYQQEQLPLLTAILLHGGVLYLAYILVYLINGWLSRGPTPILVFTGVFVVGYAVVWLVIMLVTRAQTKKLTRKLSK